MISKVQNIRKESNFEITDRINLYYNSDSLIDEAIEKYAEFIKLETLSLIIEKREDLQKSYDLNGHETYIEVEKNHYKSTCNEFDKINKKIDSNFVYLDKKIDNTKDKIVTETIDVLESFSINISNAIENVDSKINTESKERQYQIERLNNLTEYDKIVLRNLESRISILEEESQDYRRATN